jgi:carbon monoxide dehydrogenase subunit G
MIIEETFTINAPIQKVWDFFLDIEQMSRCMPGAEVRQTDPNTYEGELRAKVGPIGATFNGTVTLTNQTPPTALTAKVQAKDKMTASMVQGEFTSNLKRLGPLETEVSYKIDVTIRGKIGQFGQTVIQDTTKRLSAEFLACLKAQIETPEGQAAPAPMSSGRAIGAAASAFLAALLNAIRRWFAQALRRKAE